MIENETRSLEEIEKEAERKFDQKYLNDFIYLCLTEENLDVLERNLPDPNYHGYIELMNLLERKAAQEIELYLEMGTNDPSLHDILTKAKARLTLIQGKISEYEETLQEEQQAEKNLDSKQIIYLKSKSGNIFFEDDLDKLEPSSYDDFKKAFSFLLDGGNVFLNNSKMKDFSNNEYLRGIKECKDFQARIFYMHLMDNYVLVIMGALKKADEPKLLRERLIARRKLALEYRPQLLSKLKDPKERADLVAENSTVTERIDAKISSMKRGK